MLCYALRAWDGFSTKGPLGSLAKHFCPNGQTIIEKRGGVSHGVFLFYPK